ncbi:HAD-IA family hydrolase [Streptomyces sp. 3MP-14]|uniref:HAD-IA family hydrolase n=1 Tax=Streptomyces mimosae TaxID=2586635 RepID=A0A5N6ACP1_9ACTN|nr:MULTISPECIES: HAD-IA family hydrolase [Streptomyces]KAB8165706.1 HAD-IA family hydrolase [Streptomyces mimosae]KAB8176095.1 HAD-IA family hydrolase [Streptomyces sp. 3MP-14]
MQPPGAAPGAPHLGPPAAGPEEPAPPGRLAAVVFDFDGLLMDTESTLVEDWRNEWAFHGLRLDVDTDFWPGHGGNVTEHRLDRLAALVGPGFDRAASHARFLAHRRELHRSLGLRPGIGDWLNEARALGLRCAIASSSPLPWVRQHLTRVGAFGLFDVVATGDEVTEPKPDPAVYRLALHRLGLPAARTVAVEDTPHGVAAAHRAGMATIAIPNPFVDAAKVAAADLTLPSAAHLSLPQAVAHLENRAGPQLPGPARA